MHAHTTYATDERRDQSHASLGTCHCLNESKHEGQVAVNIVLLLELASGLDAFPCGSDLDKHAVSVDTDGFV